MANVMQLFSASISGQQIVVKCSHYIGAKLSNSLNSIDLFDHCLKLYTTTPYIERNERSFLALLTAGSLLNMSFLLLRIVAKTISQ